jgi:hypothetical protein
VTFDKRTTRIASKNSLLEYLMIKIQMEKYGFRRAMIFQADSKEVYGLQVADLIANTIYQRLGGRNMELVRRLAEKRMLNINVFPRNCFDEYAELW